MKAAAFLMVGLLGLAALPPPTAGVAVFALATGQQLVPIGGGSYEKFGWSVDVSGDTAVVGAINEDVAHVFVRDGIAWEEQARLVASDSVPGDIFGARVAIDGDTVLVSAVDDDTAGGADAGSVYVFRRTGATWTEEAKLEALDAAPGHHLGWALALDGDTAVVGAYQDDGAGPNAGAAYVFTRSGTSWTQLTKLTARDPAPSDYFGFDVALDGDTLVVGGYADATGAGVGAGSVYLYERSGGTWGPDPTRWLTASDAAGSDGFGVAVDVEGDTLAVGAYYKDSGRGAAYTFSRSGGLWLQEAKLTPADPTPGALFGHFLDLDGGTLAVSAYAHDLAGTDSGAAYVFQRAGSSWVQQAQLAGADTQANDLLGISIALDGTFLITGAPHANTLTGSQAGAAYVFAGASRGWAQQAKLAPVGGAPSDQRGASVAASGDRVVVGAFVDDARGLDAGSASVFLRTPTGWVEEARLYADDAAAADLFGASVAIDGDTIAVGAYGVNGPGSVDAVGAVYVFRRSGSSWIQEAKLTHDDPAYLDSLGVDVALKGDLLVAGASNKAGGTGAAYAFKRTGTSWAQEAKLESGDPAPGDLFGRFVSLHGNTAAIAAYGDDTGAGADAGSVYVFVRADDGDWGQQAWLTATDGATGDAFGVTVAVHGDTLAVGALLDDVGSQADAGSVQVYTRTGTLWTPQAKLTASDASASDFFGVVALEGATLVVGSFLDDTDAGVNVGSAHVFTQVGPVWVPQARFTAPSGQANALFGATVAIAGDLVVAGAPQEDTLAGGDAGAAYVFDGLPP